MRYEVEKLRLWKSDDDDPDKTLYFISVKGIESEIIVKTTKKLEVGDILEGHINMDGKRPYFEEGKPVLTPKDKAKIISFCYSYANDMYDKEMIPFYQTKNEDYPNGTSLNDIAKYLYQRIVEYDSDIPISERSAIMSYAIDICYVAQANNDPLFNDMFKDIDDMVRGHKFPVKVGRMYGALVKGANLLFND